MEAIARTSASGPSRPQIIATSRMVRPVSLKVDVTPQLNPTVASALVTSKA